MAALNNKLAAYQSVAVHGGLAIEDPHQLTLMLMDGALDRLHAARGCIERGEIGNKAQLLHRVVAIIAELRGSLDHRTGGPLAHNLDDLYEYMARQVMRANAEGRASLVEEVISLLGEIRTAWMAVPMALRGAQAR
jgi:flagellar secretion chaperone FliS